MTPQTVARQVPLSTGFPRQEYWGGLPFVNGKHSLWYRREESALGKQIRDLIEMAAAGVESCLDKGLGRK